MDTGGAGVAAQWARTLMFVPHAPAVSATPADHSAKPCDVVPVDERPSGQEHPTDPLFDREYGN
jgi:hypothetical protein